MITLQIPDDLDDEDVSKVHIWSPADIIHDFIKNAESQGGQFAAYEIRSQWFHGDLSIRAIKRFDRDMNKLARRAARSGLIFFATKLPATDLSNFLKKMGYVATDHKEEHLFSDSDGFVELIEKMQIGGLSVATFSHDAQWAYIYSG